MASAQSYGLGHSQPTGASSETTRARTAWRTSGLLWYDLQASASETDKETVVCVSARSCGTRFVGAAAASVHSLLVWARPRPLRVSSLGAAPTRFWGTCWLLRLRSYGATVSSGTSGKPKGPRSKREGTSDSGWPSPGSVATHHATSPWHGSSPRFVELGHIPWRQVVVQCHVRPDALCERGSTPRLA